MSDTITDALARIIGDNGPEILDDPRRCMSMLKDYAPKCGDEMKLLSHVFDNGYARPFAKEVPEAEREMVLGTLYYNLCNKIWLSEQAASEACSILAGALGWNVKIPGSDPQPVQTASAPPPEAPAPAPVQPAPVETQPAAAPLKTVAPAYTQPAPAPANPAAAPANQKTYNGTMMLGWGFILGVPALLLIAFVKNARFTEITGYVFAVIMFITMVAEIRGFSKNRSNANIDNPYSSLLFLYLMLAIGAMVISFFISSTSRVGLIISSTALSIMSVLSFFGGFVFAKQKSERPGFFEFILAGAVIGCFFVVFNKLR